MDQRQLELRREAARKFLEALDQLEESLNKTETLKQKAKNEARAQEIRLPRASGPPKLSRTPPPDRTTYAAGQDQAKQFTMQDLEEAAADIDQYIQSRDPLD